jgi:predicted MPP superfamily phosphohydrolase
MRWIIFIIFISFIQLYAFQAIKTVIHNKFLTSFYLIIVFIFLATFTYFLNYKPLGFNHLISYSIGFFLALLSFQLIVIIFLFSEDIIRLITGAFSYFFNNSNSKNSFFPNRRKVISQIALGIASLPFTALLYGMYTGRYNYKVFSYELEYEDLPTEFEGFKITQISDFHSGSFDNPEKVQYGLDLINNQKSDIILFTGDLVNNKTEETYPWVNAFSKLYAPNGVFSILGNHDYGDYANWGSEKEKEENMNQMDAVHKKMRWELLRNESRYIEKNGHKIAIVGVENWGKGRFKKAGDLKRAIKDVDSNDFKIIMTHDPSHWDAEILPHPYKFHLTLSGHTHGFQFGIEIPGWFKWSPIQWQYDQWAGIYKKDKQFLNVNRGFGYLAYPGRVGIWPEITVITLKKSKV